MASENREILFGKDADVLKRLMRHVLKRSVFTVRRDGDAWAVEYEGGFFGHSPHKEVAKAHAHKRAREVVDGGGGAQVRVQGEQFIG